MPPTHDQDFGGRNLGEHVGGTDQRQQSLRPGTIQPPLLHLTAQNLATLGIPDRRGHIRNRLHQPCAGQSRFMTNGQSRNPSPHTHAP